MPFDQGIDSAGNASFALHGAGMPSQLMSILELDAVDPGSEPGYQACKTIYANHPLGARMVDAPLQMAMSQERELSIPGAPEHELLKAFHREWKQIGAIGAENIIYRAMQLSYIYGISTLAVNALDKQGKPEAPSAVLKMDKIWEKDLYFNLFDPLNTAGSLVLNQDPMAMDFMHPRQVIVSGQVWSNTKTLVLMHEQPIWIQWTNSAFGFVGRSVYQRAFYPLKSFLVSMIADQMVQDKLGLLIYKSKSPGGVLDQAARAFKSMQRWAIKGSRTNNVVSIGIDEDVASLNLEHVHDAGEYARNNILKNIATAAGQPAVLLNQETLAEGFGEGSEDAKQIARYIDRVRIEMNPAYEFMDNIVMRRAWNPTFYAEIQRKYPEQYAGVSYEAAFREWQDAYEARWPNLLTEPDSEKAKAAQTKLDGATKIATTILDANPGPETTAEVCAWLADVANEDKDIFSSPLLIDADAIAAYSPTVLPEGMGDDPSGPQNPQAKPHGVESEYT